MKKIILLAVIGLFTIQAVHSQTFVNLNTYEHFVDKATTTTATATTVHTVNVADNEVGFITIKAIGFSPDSVEAITGIKSYRYVKKNGTLTLGSAVNILAPVTDTDVSSATFVASASGNNILVRVTGISGLTMYWNVIVERTASQKP